MRKNIFIFVIFIILFAIISYAAFNKEASLKANQKISIIEAEKLVRDYIFKENPNMNPEAKFPLRETTTKEIFLKINAQVFKVIQDSHMQGQDYIIKDETVSALGSYWGGDGITDMKVVDSNKDGKFELLYHYYTGSGITTFMEGIYYEPNNIQEKAIKTIP